MNSPNPIEAIIFRMDQMGWSMTDLARLTGFSLPHVSEYLNYKRKIPLSFIRAYHEIADATPLEVLIQDYELETCQCGHGKSWHFEEEGAKTCQVFVEQPVADCECTKFTPV